MVQNTREAPGPGSLRPLNLPIPISVEEDDGGRPLSVNQKAGQKAGQKSLRMKIASIDDLWRIDEEWWREKPIARMYYQLTAQSGGRLIVFQDLTDGNWYRQRG